MRINPVSMLWSAQNNNKVKKENNYIQNPIVKNNYSDSFVKSTSPLNKSGAIVFTGYDVNIIDGGSHAIDMEHLAKALGDDFDVHLYQAETAKSAENYKPLRNIEYQLKLINDYKLTDEKSYIAIPVSMTVPIQNLAEQYKRVTGDYIHLKPNTLKTQKDRVLNFLKMLYENPKKYQKYIEYMDPQNQGLEYVYGIIQEINKLKCKKVYVPVAPPYKETLNWLANEWGNKPELTNYLATGYDKDGKVRDMVNFIKEKEWYDFNLLALSNAKVVNMKELNGSDHLYSGYDLTINDGARGFYNLTPVRENGKLVGYSYVNPNVNEYPLNEFPHSEKVADIIKYVGLSTDEVVANDEQTARFKQALKEGRVTSDFDNKLYPVWKLFNENELRDQKIYEKGDFVDYKLQNYFRRNGDYKIIYPKGDSEKSGKPSVMGMWDGRASVISALDRDVSNHRFRAAMLRDNIHLDDIIAGRYRSAQEAKNFNDYRAVEYNLNQIQEHMELEELDRKSEIYMEITECLADAKFHNGNYLGSKALYNRYLNDLSKNYFEMREKDREKAEKIRKEITSVYSILAEIADKQGEEYSARVCRRAARELQKNTAIGMKVIKRRANDDINVGDLFV